jgi:hypothetical protein
MSRALPGFGGVKNHGQVADAPPPAVIAPKQDSSSASLMMLVRPTLAPGLAPLSQSGRPAGELVIPLPGAGRFRYQQLPLLPRNESHQKSTPLG